ncbi:MAG TPA: SDR family NAD(P)-dependent oxidoreductase [Candidatus Cloacimonadota bacterium]|nr:SDR family NAD(P)-dependent oxidoreductase [Candidatus Cloacimonadota bacterium]
MDILVTGGAGFIGSHLCKRLIDEGHRVVCLDNFFPFYNPAVKRNNISALIKNPAFRLVEGDIRNPVYLDRCFTDGKIEAVIHLAAMAGVRPSLNHPELYFDVNVMGTLQVLRACQKHQVKALLVASSSSVYGDRNEGAFKEDDKLEKPASPYAASKQAVEVLCELWQSFLQIPLFCLRFFTVYGPRQRPDLAIHKFTRLLYEEKPLPVYGDGTTGRDYTYVDDTVEGIIKAMDYALMHNAFEIFNLGESRPINLWGLINELEKASGKKAKIEALPRQEGDITYTCADLTKSKILLGYNPSTPFEEGIRRFIAWFESNDNLV